MASVKSPQNCKKNNLYLSSAINLITLVCLSFQAFCQQSIPSPNAASLGVFKEYPQSNYTGQPIISVPIYATSLNGFDLKFALNYNTNLLKPYILPGWVGKGWALSGGGIITRIVNDKPDDMSWSNTGHYRYSHIQDAGFFYNHGYLAGDWLNPQKMDEASRDWEPFLDAHGHTYTLDQHIKDYSPDEFSFNFGGISGSFYMDHTGNWQVASENRIKVDITSSDFNYVNSGSDYFGPLPDKRRLERIKLTDENGVIYIFGGNAAACEWDGLTNAIKSWYLTQVTLTTGQQIYFNYENGNIVSQEIPQYYYEPLDLSIPYNGPTGLITTNSKSSTAFLTKIESQDQRINFYRDDSKGLARLDSLVVIDKVTNKKVKKVSFTYQGDKYFLDKVSYFGEGSLVQSSTNFLYNGGNYVGNNFDHWGFYTSATLNTSSKVAFVASKGPDAANSNIGTLDKIYHPTGGYTQYTWEPHTYTKIVKKHKSDGYTDQNEVKIAGGVRIKKIENFTPDAAGSRTYVYGDYNHLTPNAVVSSGILSADPSYDWGNSKYYYYSPKLPMVDGAGSHIAYSKVTEIDEGGGYMTTTYSNYDTGMNNEYYDESHLGSESNSQVWADANQHFSSKQHERGKALSHQFFSSIGTMLKKVTYQYVSLNKANEFVRTYKMVRNIFAPEYFTAEGLKIYTNSYLISLINTIEYDISGNNARARTEEFIYDELLRKIKTEYSSDSRNATIVKNFKYPKDMVSSNNDPGSVYASMIAKNITAPLIEQTKTLNNVQVMLSRTNYGNFNGKYLPTSLEQKIEAYPIRKQLQFDAYDVQGNLLQQQSATGLKISNVWGYNNQYVVAQFKNASIDEVFFADVDERGQLLEHGTETNPFGLNYIQDATFKYAINLGDLPGYLEATIALEAGREYEMTYWDKDSDLDILDSHEIIADENLGQRDGWVKRHVVFTVNNSSSWLWLNANVGLIRELIVKPRHSSVTSYTYKPMVGITSITGPNGMTTYFEYDGFGRLTCEKDHLGKVLKVYYYNYAQ